MTTDEKIESLTEQAAALPEEAQAAFIQSVIEMRYQYLAIDHFHDEQL